ncbi:MAG: hypothetical protein K2O12_07200, partial [Muribaculaceae bacterium]|nr:hypothetical protein [Muribaculaceae bacterium]
MFKTKKLWNLMLALGIAILSAGFVSCSDDDNPSLPGNGIENAQWAEINDVAIEGEILVYEFDAPAAWTAVSSESWCKLLTTKGGKGTSSLRIDVEPNEGDMGRSATVTIQLEGYADPCVITIRQGDGFLEKGDGRYREVNQWIYEMMGTYYLWNEPISELRLDYSLDYQLFLSSVLNGVASFNDVNHDDGYWVNGQRQAYYSYIQSNAPISRSAGETFTSSGLMIIPTILGPNDDDPCGFAVMWVIPGSPADEAGVKRGDFIRTVNKVAVTTTNYVSLGNSVLNGNVTVDLNSVKFVNGVAQITNRVSSVLIGKDTFVDPSIYKWDVITADNGKKIGYLLYMGFHSNYDSKLIEVFSQFKSQGIDELIVDLRYNNGGHVVSSTVLGTLIAGQAHKGDIYVRTTYNKNRTEAGEVGEYRIGVSDNPESTAGYDLIAQALDKSLGLNQVYVIGTATTASASELLINGLRGLDIKVNLIGTTTNGKNVGMEGWRKKINNYSFEFYPITFYCENAKGFRDYSNGFKPDLEVDDSPIYPGDFG